MNGHGFDGDGPFGIEKFIDDGPLPGFKGQLAQPVIGPGAGGLGIQMDEHDYLPVAALMQASNFSNSCLLSCDKNPKSTSVLKTL